jgi:cellulose synthase/poly-beta-1,6-N-acetylglucosamine synthase-like glycosyltransferase
LGVPLQTGALPAPKILENALRPYAVPRTRKRFIEATIRSIAAQTYRNLKILVLDNNSSDSTKAKLEGLKGAGGETAALWRNKEPGAHGGLNSPFEIAVETIRHR